MDYISAAASEAAFDPKNPEASLDGDERISVESLPESNGFLNFTSFARECPDRFFELISHLRPEFQELAIESWLLEKSQYFLGPAHGFIQTRVWQSLRIIEQAMGAMIILGTNPTEKTLRDILKKTQHESTEHGPLSKLIVQYAASRDYATVAKSVKTPVPAIRKLFRPAIVALLADKDVKVAAVGAYLRNLTHRASLKGAGLSKKCSARLRRLRSLKFNAPPSNNNPLMNFGPVESLGDESWCMLEISSELRWTQIRPNIQSHVKRAFGSTPVQVFAPANADGSLQFGYVFVRAAKANLIRSFLRVQGISEISASYSDSGNFVAPIAVPDADVQNMIQSYCPPENPSVHVNNFVRISTGATTGYHGTVTSVKPKKILVRIDFPTRRCFVVTADPSSVELVPAAISERAFWGKKIS